MMRSMFPPERYQVFAFHFPVAADLTGSTRFRIGFRGLEAQPLARFQSIKDRLTDYEHANVIHDSPVARYLFVSYYKLLDLFFEHMAGGTPVVHTALTAEERAEGAAQMRALGVDDDRPVATVHVREAGWANDGHFQSWRDSDIATYVPALRLLRDRGYAVVRIGDRSMKRLPDLGPGVIDAATNPTYAEGAVNDGLFDIYAIERSAFMIAHGSGPLQVAHALGTPTLLVNSGAPWSSQNVNDLMLFKDYVDRKSGRRLSLREISEHFLFDQIDFADPGHFDIELEDLPMEVVTAAVAELLERLEAERASGPIRTSVDELFTARVREIQQRRNAILDGAPDATLAGLNRERSLERRHVNFGLPRPRLASTYAAFNPDFLRP